MSSYQLIVGSPVAYEELTVDIVISDKYILRVQKAEGNDKMKVDFFSKLPIKYQFTWTISLKPCKKREMD